MQYDYSKVLDILDQIAAILAAGQHDGQADYVRGLIAQAPRSATSFRDGLVSIDMWGGSGAVWDARPLLSLEEEKRFLRLLVALTEEMAAVGIRNARAEEIAAVFRYWLETDVWSQIAAAGPSPPVQAPHENYIKRYLDEHARRDRKGQNP
ncbi:MAG: hypothetical protein ACREHD_13670 [Pirellulales bacterium]